MESDTRHKDHCPGCGLETIAFSTNQHSDEDNYRCFKCNCWWSRSPKANHNASGSIEPIEYIRAQGWLKDFCKGNIVKYLSRYPLKGGVDDLKKARQYLDWLIAEEEK